MTDFFTTTQGYDRENILTEYSQLALRTECDNQEVLNRTFFPREQGGSAGAVRSMHAVLGLASDIHELAQSTDDINEIEEIGDMFWFLNLYATELGVDFYESILCPALEERDIVLYGKDIKVQLRGLVADITDEYKAMFIYSKPIEKEDTLDLLKRTAEYLVDLSVLVLGKLEQTCKQGERRRQACGIVLLANIDKLAVRFPGKFSATEQNRDKHDKYEAILHHVDGYLTDVAPQKVDVEVEVVRLRTETHVVKLTVWDNTSIVKIDELALDAAKNMTSEEAEEVEGSMDVNAVYFADTGDQYQPLS